MNDDRAELALRRALASRAEAFAPATRELPDPWRRRRRWPTVLAAAILVVAVVLVGAALRSHHDATPAKLLPSGWRWESHADVMVAVPATWGYAASPASDWCAATGHRRALPQPGYVDTRPPGGGVLDIMCGGAPPLSLTAPHLSFPVDLVGDEISLPAGWVRDSRTVGGTRLVVTMDSAHRALAAQILATAHTVTTDQNGCATTSPIQDQLVGRPMPPFDVASLHHVDSIAVCQYQLDVTTPGLVASRLLTGADADAELAALRDAATKSGPDRGHGCSAADRGTTGITLLLRSDGQIHEMYAFYSGCTRNGLDDGTSVRELTTADCRPLFDSQIIDTEGIRPAFERCTGS